MISKKKYNVKSRKWLQELNIFVVKLKIHKLVNYIGTNIN